MKTANNGQCACMHRHFSPKPKSLDRTLIASTIRVHIGTDSFVLYALQIADFGMSRDLQDADYYVSSGGLIPVRWTAPEAVHFKKYSTASDIWSYGCVLYEIWSLGTKPFEGIGNVEVLQTGIIELKSQCIHLIIK